MNIQFKKNIPFCEEVSIEDIIQSCSTPFYLYSQKIIKETYDHLRSALSSEIFFAVKANSNQAILRLIKNCGAGADVVSAGELQRAIHAGFDPSKIIFEGVGKSKEDIEYAIQQNIRLINVESINELRGISKIGSDTNQAINVGVRLNPDLDANTLNKISTGKKTDKFGIALNQLNEIITIAKSSNHINLMGISCHIGSQINEISIFKKIFTVMKEAAEIVLSSDIILKHIDLGGGFAVNYEKEHNDLDILSIGKLVNSVFQDVPYEVSFEPGRYLVAKAGIIVTKILTTKENGGINFLITDAGMHTLLRPAMYGAIHRIEALNNLNEQNVRYTVAGPICESSDIISKDIYLPMQKEENYLVIHDVGAYGAVMASQYNSRELPTEILVNENKFSVIYQKEDISEIIKQDIIPEWL